ncbi:MAG TPA: alpha/beta hydrolase [Verrucomicrobiae bacterium]|nr:alpha/beta hydrolase [Verrucomicrobiae bacterium]
MTAILVLLTILSAGGLLAAETNAVTPKVAAAGPLGAARVTRDIAYATNSPRQNFDLYVPREGQGPFPLVVWIHGGAWMLGSKDWINVSYLVRHGYAIASIDYRFSQDAPFPAQIQDCNAALNFILAHAAEYGVDRSRLVVGGGSAGGHLALLLGLARSSAGFGADAAVRLAAILDFFGPADFTTSLADLQAIHSEKGIQLFHDAVSKLLNVPSPLSGDLPAAVVAKERAASPVNYIGSNSPPVLILHGGKDDLVPVAQSRGLAAALDKAGVRNRLLVVPDAGHDGPMFATPEVEAAVVEFLRR